MGFRISAAFRVWSLGFVGLRVQVGRYGLGLKHPIASRLSSRDPCFVMPWPYLLTANPRKWNMGLG